MKKIRDWFKNLLEPKWKFEFGEETETNVIHVKGNSAEEAIATLVKEMQRKGIPVPDDMVKTMQDDIAEMRRMKETMTTGAVPTEQAKKTVH